MSYEEADYNCEGTLTCDCPDCCRVWKKVYENRKAQEKAEVEKMKNWEKERDWEAIEYRASLADGGIRNSRYKGFIDGANFGKHWAIKNLQFKHLLDEKEARIKELEVDLNKAKERFYCVLCGRDAALTGKMDKLEAENKRLRDNCESLGHRAQITALEIQSDIFLSRVKELEARTDELKEENNLQLCKIDRLEAENKRLREAIEKHLPELRGKSTRGPVYKDLYEALWSKGGTK